MSWIQAVKEFNKDKGTWTLPKKNTPEYESVKKIQERILADKAGSEPVPEPAPAPPKKEKVVKTPAKPVKDAKPERPRSEPVKETPPPTTVVHSGPRKPYENVVVLDLDEYRRLSAAPTIHKPAAEALPVRTKEEKAAEKEKKKALKLEMIQVRSELAKAKVEKNKGIVEELSKKLKELKSA
jgi:hypothetical protein